MHGCRRLSGTCAVTVANALFVLPWMPGAAAQEIKGVSPSDLPKYRSGAFHCLHDHGASRQLLPLSAVNDEFCDCSDGSDEPGTSACAGQLQTLFYCKNEGSDTAFIYTSRVNDGICDCCDGSDEWRAAQASSLAPGICPNTCVEEGRKLAEERARREAGVKSGIKQRKNFEQTAKVELAKRSEDLASKRQELGRLQAEVLQAKATLESVTALHEAASQAAANTSAESATDSQGQSSGNTPDTALLTESTPTAPGRSTEEKNLEGDATEASATNADPTSAAAEQASSSDDTVVSEYTKWMDGAEKTSGGQEADSVDRVDSNDDGEDYFVRLDDHDLDDDSPDAQSETSNTDGQSETSNTLEERRKEEPAGFLAWYWSKVRATALLICRKIWICRKPHAQGDKEVAEQAYAGLQQRVSTSQAEISKLEENIETFTGEYLLAFMSLDKRCISMKDNQYKWELCFFAKAKQDDTSLGKWQKWERPGVGVFANGDQCWGGPQRSLRVLFHCGPNEEMYDVSEPSRCSYEAHVRHPAACTQEVLQGVWPNGPRMPNEEL